MTPGKHIAVLSSAGAGGGGIAAKRMADAISEAGAHTTDFIDISLLGESVPQSVSPQDSVTNNRISDTHFTVEFSGYQRGWLVDMLSQYDLLNIHWSSFLISISELLELALRKRPMLFMLHDFYYITGGCHYPATCTQLGSGCLDCPQVDTRRCPTSVIAENYKIKTALFAQDSVHLAAPSAFLRDKAIASGIVPQARAHVLRNAYQPVLPFDPDRPFSRRILLIADSLYEGRKNMRFALEVLAKLHLKRVNFVVDVVGTAAPEMVAYLAATGVRHTVHGRITDHNHLAAIMAQTDLLLTTSLEDNWPNILVEAGSYGCIPVVGPGHGCEEFVRQYRYGAVAADYSVPAFVEALTTCLDQNDVANRKRSCQAIRTEHSPAQVARDFAAVMDSMTSAMNQA